MVTTSFFLDKRYGDAVGGHPLKLVFNLKSTRSLLSLGVVLKPSQWDAKCQAVVSHPAKGALNAMLMERRVEVNKILYDLAVSGASAGMSVSAVKNLVAERLFPAPAEESPRGTLFLPRLDAFIATKQGGTERLYKATRSRMAAYLGAANLEGLSFEDMDVGWLRAFDAWLARSSPSRNARNIHFRNIRTVFNEAITDELITCYPFRKFKMRPEATRKRALSPEQWRRLLALDLEPHMVRYRDCFVLIFLLCGINIVDLCSLGAPVDGRAEYRRAKTHRLYSIRVEPEAAALLERYRGQGQALNYLDSCRGYRSFYSRLCVALRKMGERIGVEGLSTYWARHTWATFAARLDIPKETIAAALGHGGDSVTDIYIDFDRAKVDAANRRVIDFAFGL